MASAAHTRPLMIAPAAVGCSRLSACGRTATEANDVAVGVVDIEVLRAPRRGGKGLDDRYAVGDTLLVERFDPIDTGRGVEMLVVAAPLGFIAIETGWSVTEVGRQPWIIYGVMRTSEAVTPMPGLIVPFITFTVLYIFLAVITVWLLLRQVAASPHAPAKEATVAA